MREIEMFNSNLRYLRLIVPWRCELLLLSTLRWGDKKRMRGEAEKQGGRQGIGGKRQSEGYANKKYNHTYDIAHTQMFTHPQESVRPKKTLITDEYLQHSLSLGSPWELISDIYQWNQHTVGEKTLWGHEVRVQQIIIFFLKNLISIIFKLTNYSMKFIEYNSRKNVLDNMST